jgi:magnesium-transporting ATPase (P-type)
MRSQRENGVNVLTKKKERSFFRCFLSNLGDPVIRILLGALAVHLVLVFKNGDLIETAGIAVAVVLAALISTLSEYSSARAFERLSFEDTGAVFRVWRDGEVHATGIGDIVVGDVLMLSAGEQIPADGYLISGEISCDQSAMTGESREVYKKPLGASEELTTTPTSRHFCMRGCAILQGEGELIVTAVGGETFLGGISKEIQTDTRESPLKIRLTKLAKQISAVGYVAAALVALVYLFNIFFIDSAFDSEIIRYKIQSLPFLFEHLLHALTLALTVIVVAVPEGTPFYN